MKILLQRRWSHVPVPAPQAPQMPYGHPLKEEAKEQHGATYVGEIKLWVLPTNYPDFDKHVEWFKERKMLFNLKHMELAYLDLPNMSPSQRVGKRASCTAR